MDDVSQLILPPSDVWLPPRPAIIRPDIDIANYFPFDFRVANREERRSIIGELKKRGVDPTKLAMLPGLTFLQGNHRPNLMEILQQSGLTTNLELVLDAGALESAPPGTTKWLDLSGNGFDFFRGTNGADGAMPTFNGTPGGLSVNEYWGLAGGQFFRYDAANETWMQNLHKNNAIFSCIFWVYYNTTNGALFGNNGSSSSGTGAHALVSTELISRPSMNNGTWARSDTTSASVSNGVWHMISIGINEATGANGTDLGIDLTFEAFTSTYSSPSANNPSFTMELAARGNGNQAIPSGGRMAMAAFWEGTRLTTTNFTTIFNATRTRFNV